MNIYHFHPETGLYIGQGKADPSPLEPGVWLIPAHATTDVPPKPGDGKQAVWSNGAWMVQPIPEPEPEPHPIPELVELPLVEQTPMQKLANIGLTIAELRDLLELD